MVALYQLTNDSPMNAPPTVIDVHEPEPVWQCAWQLERYPPCCAGSDTRVDTMRSP
jgi:hypothetical protein